MVVHAGCPDLRVVRIALAVPPSDFDTHVLSPSGAWRAPFAATLREALHGAFRFCSLGNSEVRGQRLFSAARARVLGAACAPHHRAEASSGPEPRIACHVVTSRFEDRHSSSGPL